MSVLQSCARPAERLSLLDRLYRFYDDRRARHRAIRQLSRLDDRDLRDIGIDRHDIDVIVDREIGRFRLDEFRSRWV